MSKPVTIKAVENDQKIIKKIRDDFAI